VAVLLLCGWLLSGRFPGLPTRDPPTVTSPDAKKIPLPDLTPEGKPAPGKVRSKISLEQSEDGTGIRIDAVADPSGK
jgi:hypothetical protein